MMTIKEMYKPTVEKLGTRNTEFFRFCKKGNDYNLVWSKGTPYRVSNGKGDSVVVYVANTKYSGNHYVWNITEAETGCGCGYAYNKQQDLLNYLKTDLNFLEKTVNGKREFLKKFGKTVEELLSQPRSTV